MRIVFCIVAFVLLIWMLSSSAQGQEERSVLVNPPERIVQTQSVQPMEPPACVPQQPTTIILFERGLFGRWYARPVQLVPVQPMIVQPPKPVVIWVPKVVWR